MNMSLNAKDVYGAFIGKHLVLWLAYLMFTNMAKIWSEQTAIVHIKIGLWPELRTRLFANVENWAWWLLNTAKYLLKKKKKTLRILGESLLVPCLSTLITCVWLRSRSFVCELTWRNRTDLTALRPVLLGTPLVTISTSVTDSWLRFWGWGSYLSHARISILSEFLAYSRYRVHVHRRSASMPVWVNSSLKVCLRQMSWGLLILSQTSLWSIHLP